MTDRSLEQPSVTEIQACGNAAPRLTKLGERFLLAHAKAIIEDECLEHINARILAVMHSLLLGWPRAYFPESPDTEFWPHVFAIDAWCVNHPARALPSSLRWAQQRGAQVWAPSGLAPIVVERLRWAPLGEVTDADLTLALEFANPGRWASMHWPSRIIGAIELYLDDDDAEGASCRSAIV